MPNFEFQSSIQQFQSAIRYLESEIARELEDNAQKNQNMTVSSTEIFKKMISLQYVLYEICCAGEFI